MFDRISIGVTTRAPPLFSFISGGSLHLLGAAIRSLHKHSCQHTRPHFVFHKLLCAHRPHITSVVSQPRAPTEPRLTPPLAPSPTQCPGRHGCVGGARIVESLLVVVTPVQVPCGLGVAYSTCTVALHVRVA